MDGDRIAVVNVAALVGRELDRLPAVQLHRQTAVLGLLDRAKRAVLGAKLPAILQENNPVALGKLPLAALGLELGRCPKLAGRLAGVVDQLVQPAHVHIRMCKNDARLARFPVGQPIGCKLRLGILAGVGHTDMAALAVGVQCFANVAACKL
ncbi:hypothetical protein R69746_07737 [Paraburkholderia aspalathi]|nr:hypothetical protein R69746_07737 [Paraburkholderia aspalathi]